MVIFVDDIMAAFMEDEALGQSHAKFKDDPEEMSMLKEKTVTYFKFMLGGIKRYIGRPLDEVHCKLGISDQMFDAAVAKIIDCLKKMRK